MYGICVFYRFNEFIYGQTLEEAAENMFIRRSNRKKTHDEKRIRNTKLWHFFLVCVVHVTYHIWNETGIHRKCERQMQKTGTLVK